jgi:hypothetical protein
MKVKMPFYSPQVFEPEISVGLAPKGARFKEILSGQVVFVY